MIKLMHFYGTQTYLEKGKETIVLDQVQYMIYDMLNKKTAVDDIVKYLTDGLHIADNELQLLRSRIEEFKEKCELQSLYPVKNTVISGEKGKYYPKTLNIEMTNGCNLQCTHCYKNATAQSADYVDRTIFDILTEKYAGKIPILHLTGGEPLLYPHIDELLVQLLPYFRINITTNGLLIPRLDKQTIKRIGNFQISLYGHNEKAYAQVTKRTGMYKQILKSFDLLDECNVFYDIGINLNRMVIDNIDEYIQLLNARNVKYVIFSEIGRAGRGKQKDAYWTITEKDRKKLKEITRGKLKAQTNLSIQGNEKLSDEKDDECSAGRTQLTVSENNSVVYCNVLDHDAFRICNFSDIDNYLQSGFDKEDFVMRLKHFCNHNDCRDNICPILEKMNAKSWKTIN